MDTGEATADGSSSITRSGGELDLDTDVRCPSGATRRKLGRLVGGFYGGISQEVQWTIGKQRWQHAFSNRENQRRITPTTKQSFIVFAQNQWTNERSLGI
jgi:hypothetical protein